MSEVGDFLSQPWVIVTLACAVGLVATGYALFAGGRAARPGPPTPAWLVPTPTEVRHARFPLGFQGYEPAHVDVFVDALTAAYEELYFAAGPSTVQRARARLAARLGVETQIAPRPPALQAQAPRSAPLFQPVPRVPRPSGEELEDLGGDGPGVLDG